MERRSAFVAEVAATIANWHCKERESFVLGLSGRWGEGKSYFLGELQTELQSRGFQVLDLNPWKYAADRVAFLRAFLVQLLETQTMRSRFCAAGRLVRRGQMADAWAVLGPRRRLLDRLKTDVTKQRISISRLLLLLVPVGTVYWLYTTTFSVQAKSVIDQLRLPITLFLIPVSVWLIQGLVNSQVSSKAATAIDEFDSLVWLALGAPDVKNGKPVRSWGVRNVVVFVDDLDRVTADVARGVLDNLRTFFDKPLLSFVVTGDHSVLEASLGRELAPNREADQLEEGRRFMKKVFNLYWRLPRPVRSDFEAFVDLQLTSRQAELEKYLPLPQDRVRLRQSLLDFCDTNLRLVIRTLDMLLFSLQLVKAQADAAANDEERSSLQQVLDAPMLLSRVLLLQDRCTPLFELMVESPGLLVELDRRVSLAQDAVLQGGEHDPVGQFLGEHGGRVSLNVQQLEFLKRFAYQPPLFYDAVAGGQIVANPGPWLHLAGDLSFKDASGPTTDDFLRDVANLNAESVSAAIAVCSPAKADEVANAVINGLADIRVTTEISDRVRTLLFLLKQSKDAEPEARLANSLVTSVSTWLDLLIDGVSETQRAEILVAFLGCLDHQGSPLPVDNETSMEFRDPATLPALPRHAYGPLGSQLVVDWLVTYYAQNPEDCMSAVDGLLPHVEAHSLARLADIAPQVVTDLISDADDGRRTQRAKVLHLFTPEGSELLSSTVFGALDREDVWDWAGITADAQPDAVPWTRAGLRSALLDWVADAPDASQLLDRLRYSAGKLDDVSDDLWRRLYAERDGDLLGLLDAFAEDVALSPLAVPTDVATELYEDRVNLVEGTRDDGHATGLAGVLAPQVWLWTNVDGKAARAALRPLAYARARRRRLQALVRPFWEAWTTDGGYAEVTQVSVRTPIAF